MYARVVKFTLQPDSQWEANRMADVIAGIAGKQRGCKRLYFLNDYFNGEYEWVSFWETQEEWEQSYKNVVTELIKMLPDTTQWHPAVQLFEVYEPKSAGHY